MKYFHRRCVVKHGDKEFAAHVFDSAQATTQNSAGIGDAKGKEEHEYYVHTETPNR